jgi:hypothetical protein
MAELEHEPQPEREDYQSRQLTVSGFTGHGSDLNGIYRLTGEDAGGFPVWKSETYYLYWQQPPHAAEAGRAGVFVWDTEVEPFGHQSLASIPLSNPGQVPTGDIEASLGANMFSISIVKTSEELEDQQPSCPRGTFLKHFVRREEPVTRVNTLHILKVRHWAAVTIQSQWKQSTTTTRVQVLQKEMSTRRRQNWIEQQATESRVAVQAVEKTKRTKEIMRLLNWNSATATKFATFQSNVNQALGLKPVKEFVRQRIADMAGRTAASDSAQCRHIMIFGELGTGKNIASKTVCDLFILANYLTGRTSQIPEAGKIKRNCAYEIVLSKWKDPDEEKNGEISKSVAICRCSIHSFEPSITLLAF